MGVNKAILLGNLGQDPELRYTSNQTPVCTLRLATGERRKDQSGNWVDHTEWHSVVAFGKTAENCCQYLSKGRQIYVEGRIQTRKWQDKEGRDRYSTEIVANTVQFIGGRPGGSAGAVQKEESRENNNGSDLLETLASADEIETNAEVSFSDDDIPF